MGDEKYSDAEILEAVQQTLGGSRDSFRVIVGRFNGSVYRLCRAYTGSEDDAADALQDIFLRVFKSLSSYKMDKKFSTWLFSIVMNHLKTRYGRVIRLKAL